jgi:pyrrolidone-carboxylate peptidase
MPLVICCWATKKSTGHRIVIGTDVAISNGVPVRRVVDDVARAEVPDALS